VLASISKAKRRTNRKPAGQPFAATVPAFRSTFFASSSSIPNWQRHCARTGGGLRAAQHPAPHQNAHGEATIHLGHLAAARPQPVAAEPAGLAD
jgi:hypothetical protein